MANLKQKFLQGFLWSLIGQGGYFIIALVTNIILARLLSPYEFGQVGIVMFFIIIARVISESGLTGALVRKPDVSEEDYSTVFIFNLIISIVLVLCLFISSEYIAAFYSDFELKEIIQVLSVVLIVNSFQFVQNAKIVRALQYKRKSIYTFVSIVIASTTGIIMANLDYGVWSMVYMQIVNATCFTILLWLFEGPVQSYVFRRQSFMELYKFGLFTTSASLINSVFDNVYHLILGKYFSISQTGFFYQAKKLQEVPVGVVQASTLGVVFSTLSRLQNDLVQFDLFYKRIVKMFTVGTGLIVFLLYFYAEEIVLLLYGQKWIESVFYLRILVISSYFYMQEMFNRVLFKVFDRTEKILFLEIIKKTIQSITIAVGLLMLNLDVLLFGYLFTSIVSYFINYHYSRRVYGEFSWEEVGVVVKVALVCFICVQLLTLLGILFNIEQYYLFYLLPIGLFFYYLLIKLFKVTDILSDSKTVILEFKKK